VSVFFGVVDVIDSEVVLLVANGELTPRGSAGGVDTTKTVVSTVIVAVVDWVDTTVLVVSSGSSIVLAIVFTVVEVGKKCKMSVLEATASNVLGAAVLSGAGIAWRKVDHACEG
jgi:hypothetical protein